MSFLSTGGYLSRRVRPLSLAFVSCALASTVYADDIAFVVLNDTKKALVELSISKAGTGEWHNQLEGTFLLMGGKADMAFSGVDSCNYDLRFTLARGGSGSVENVDLCQAGNVFKMSEIIE